MKSLKDLPFHFKVFVGLFLCLAGLAYISLLASIGVDTEMKISYIIEGYGGMDPIELISHSFQYLLWFFVVFAFINCAFMLTSFSSGLKTALSVTTVALIVLDIASAWLVRAHVFFAYLLFACGVLLALSFLIMFLLIQSDLWKKPLHEKN